MTWKLTTRKHVRMSPHWNCVPTELYNDGHLAGYFLRTLRKLLRSRGYGELPFFIGTPSLLQGTTYFWNIRVVMYEKSTTDRIRCTHQVIEATAPRMSFKAGLRDAARQAWPCYVTSRMIRWSIPSNVTSQAEPVKELMLWCCLSEIATVWDVCRTKCN
jgi:hypothetical protein